MTPERAAFLALNRRLYQGIAMPPRCYTLAQIKRANSDAGFHFFDPGALRFFSSRVSDEVFQGPTGVYFVTSEKNRGDARRYTVRRFDPVTSEIQTAGVFQGHKTSRQAKAAAKAFASLGSP